MDFMLPAVACNALFYSVTSFSSYLSSTQNIFKFIVEHKDSEYSVFQRQLEATDLTNKLEITASLIRDVIRRYCSSIDDASIKAFVSGVTSVVTEDGVMIDAPTISLDEIPEPIKMSLLSLLETSNKIHVLIETIHQKMHQHQSSYMKSLKKINIGTDVSKIVFLTGIFNGRLDLLLTLLKIYFIGAC